MVKISVCSYSFFEESDLMFFLLESVRYVNTNMSLEKQVYSIYYVYL